MSLRDIYCQDGAIDILERALNSGKLGHAYIFAGLDGVGRFKTAKEWVKVLLCKSQQKDLDGFVDSCGGCSGCVMVDADSHPDVHRVYKELYPFTEKGKGKKTPVYLNKPVIDEFLIDKVAVRPSEGDYSVYIISEAEKLNAAAQNAMLKVLEEPPSYCFIVLLCSRLENLLPTTRSRCQVVKFGPIDEDIIVKELTVEEVSEKESLFWARFGEGSLSEAMDWSRAGAYEAKCELVKKLGVFGAADVPETAEELGAVIKELSDSFGKLREDVSSSDVKRDVQKGIIRFVISAMGDVIKFHLGETAGMVNADQGKCIERIASRVDIDGAGERINKGYELMKWIEASVNEKLVVEQLLIGGCV